MREYKFRAWDKSCKKIVKVDRIKFNEREIDVIIDKTEGVESFYSLPLEDAKMMQFTGLKDGEGTEVFEGDIISGIYTHDNDVYGICYCHSRNEVLVAKIREDFGGKIAGLNEINWNLVRVIGNIYENPELLEVTK